MNDQINSLFEVVGGFVLWYNVYKLYQDKVVKGVYWGTTLFFMLWSFWNLTYYSSLNQWWSFFGAISLASANAAWLGLLFYYRNFNENEC